MTNDLHELKRDIAQSAQRGYPILIAGSVCFLLLAAASLTLPQEVIHLLWVVGLGAIFPLGVLLGKVLHIDILSTRNPLGTLGGLVAGVQAGYIPVFIMIYQTQPEWLPFTVGLLAGSHFLPYFWIYNSKGYLFLTISTCVVSFIVGGYFRDVAFILTPLAISLTYAITVLLLRRENRQDGLNIA